MKKLKALITSFHPKLVIFYGSNNEYREYWENIAGSSFDLLEIDGKGAYTCNKNDILYIVANHPVSFGMTIKYFEELGRCASIKVSGEDVLCNPLRAT